MSVEFRNVVKNVGRGGSARVLFGDLNFRIEAGDRIAVLAPPKSGKTTLLRMICGTDYASAGTIDRSSSVSWPIPLGDFVVGNSTLATNIRFMMRLYGVDDENVLRKIAALVEISDFLNNRLVDCPKYVKARLSFALGVGLGFDVCLFDERVSAVDKEFKPRAVEIVKSISPDKAIFAATSAHKEVAELCHKVFVLEDGNLAPCADMNEGIERYKALMVKNEDNEPEPSDASIEPVEEEFVLEIGI